MINNQFFFKILFSKMFTFLIWFLIFAKMSAPWFQYDSYRRKMLYADGVGFPEEPLSNLGRIDQTV